MGLRSRTVVLSLTDHFLVRGPLFVALLNGLLKNHRRKFAVELVLVLRARGRGSVRVCSVATNWIHGSLFLLLASLLYFYFLTLPSPLSLFFLFLDFILPKKDCELCSQSFCVPPPPKICYSSQYRPYSLMDKTRGFYPFDVGSIPTRGALVKNNCTAVVFYKV